MPHRRRGGGPPGNTPPARTVDSRGAAPGGAGGGGGGGGKAEEERVLISEIVIRDKDGGELEDEELLKVVAGALKVSKANAALTTREVQEDVHRIIDTGYFASCLPTAEDTRDGVRLIFRVRPRVGEKGGEGGVWVEANQEMKGLMCVGANVLPTRVIEDAFRDEYGKVVNIQRLNGVLDVLNGWYSDRGLFGQVTDVELLSDGVVRVKVAEAEVNNITIKFRDRKTGEPTTGKTRPETILRQLMTKKGQVGAWEERRGRCTAGAAGRGDGVHDGHHGGELSDAPHASTPYAAVLPPLLHTGVLATAGAAGRGDGVHDGHHGGRQFDPTPCPWRRSCLGPICFHRPPPHPIALLRARVGQLRCTSQAPP
ncbi:unnamed protein product [Closterium sp. NIES-65]|nr:unnamed protein product [Closterium sp. NIES-65]